LKGDTMLEVSNISTQVLAILIEARETRRRLERTMPDATAAAISYVIADPHGTQEWGEALSRLEPGFRPSPVGEKPAVQQTYWDLPVKDWEPQERTGRWEPRSSTVTFLPLLDRHNRATQVAIHRRNVRHQGTLPPCYAVSEDQIDQPDGLDGLVGYQAVIAERRATAGGPELDRRTRVLASVLGVDSKALTKYVQGLLRKTPSENRWSHQEDLEQAISTMLYKARAWVDGSLERAYIVASGAYKDWYSLHSNYRQLGVEAQQRAISLERHYAVERQDAEGVGHDLADPSWVGWEEAVADNADAWYAMASLPEQIQNIVERKANGVPIAKLDRNRLSLFLGGGPTKAAPNLPTNKDVLASVMAGTHVGPIRWAKPKRK